MKKELLESEYAKLVEDVCKNKEDVFIENSTLDHAIIIYYYLVKQSKKFMKIFTGSFSELFYEHPLIKQVTKNAIENGIDFQIITTNKKIPNIYKRFIKKEKIEVKFIEPIKNENHFMVSDGQSFRVELPHKIGELKNIRGKANFNNSTIGNHILRIFENKWEKAEIII